MNFCLFTLQLASVCNINSTTLCLSAIDFLSHLKGHLQHFKLCKCEVSGLHWVGIRVKQCHLENTFWTSFLPLGMLKWCAEEFAHNPICHRKALRDSRWGVAP